MEEVLSHHSKDQNSHQRSEVTPEGMLSLKVRCMEVETTIKAGATEMPVGIE